MDQLYDRKYYDWGLFEIGQQLWVDLAEMTREDVTARCEISFDDVRQGYLVPLLSHPYVVHPLEKKLPWEMSMSAHPKISNSTWSCSPISPNARMRGSLTKWFRKNNWLVDTRFSRAFMHWAQNPLIKVFGKDPQGFSLMGQRLGGIPEKFGDVSFTVRVLPKVPVRFTLYAEDEEFGASLKVMFDASIERYFRQIDLVWGLFNLAVEHILFVHLEKSIE